MICLGQSDILIGDIVSVLTGGGTQTQRLIILEFRLPRVVSALLIGTGMALSGHAMQTVLKNDLANPGILGINSGATFFPYFTF